jgi:hypothetical protein
MQKRRYVLVASVFLACASPPLAVPPVTRVSLPTAGERDATARGARHAAGVTSPILVGSFGAPHSATFLLRPHEPLVCWGSRLLCRSHDVTGLEQLWDPSPRLQATVPDDIADAVQIAPSNDYACALFESGRVKCWGPGAAYLLNEKDDNGLFDIPGWTHVWMIAGGDDHTCAILEDGSVEWWGDNEKGERADPKTLPLRVPNLTNVNTLAAGQRFTCAAADDGSVACWGTNRDGELGDGSFQDRVSPAPVDGLPPIVSLRAEEDTVCALSRAGEVFCWGLAENGQIPDALPARTAPRPVRIQGLPEVTEIAAGGSEVCARTASGVYCWGSSAWLPHRSDDRPVMMPLPEVVTLGLGGFHGCALTQQGSVLCFGNNQSGELGNGTRQYSQTPTEVRGLGGASDQIPLRAAAVRTPNELRPGAATVTGPGVRGAFSADVVKRIVRQNFPRFRLCFENGLRDHPDLEGQITTRFEIDGNGLVTSANIADSSLKDPTVEACVARGFGAISFPKPSGGAVKVSYTIAFDHGVRP